ncbi:MAG: VWA domain-containing protein [Coriobacteriia bacterium]|nr:VWA domain-containing protein [Coriobacteriia bacterium]
MVCALVASPRVAHAVTGEGQIGYDGGVSVNADGSTTPNGPTIDPFADLQKSVSGSKSATSLDLHDQSNVTFSLPAQEYQSTYDVVLLTDSTASFSPMTANAKDFLGDLANNLVSRGATINVGAVSFGTVAYTKFTAGSGLNWMGYSLAMSNGVQNTLNNPLLGPALQSAMNGFTADQQTMLKNLAPLGSAFPTGVVPAGGYSESYHYLLGNDTTGLMPLTDAATGSTSAASLNSALQLEGSKVAARNMLVYGAYTNSSIVSTLGYSMDNPVIGTNLEAGVKAAQRMLAVDSTTPAQNKYLVILTDGGSYFYDGTTESTDTPATDSYTNALTNTAKTVITPGHIAVDYNGMPQPIAALSMPFGNFLTDTDVLTNFKSTIKIGDYETYNGNLTRPLGPSAQPASAYPGIAGLATSSANSATYPYAGIERGTAWAAEHLKEIADSHSSRIILLGSPYNPTWPWPQATQTAKAFMDWAKQTVATNSYDISTTTTSADISDAFDGIVNDLTYQVSEGTLTDTIGPEFKLVTTGASGALAAGDIKIALADGSIDENRTIDSGNPNLIDYGTPDGTTGLYPYTALYTPGSPGKITVTINVPVEIDNRLTIDYKLQLARDTSVAGWHENVKLNDSAVLDYTSSNGQAGSVAFPVPYTRYCLETYPYTVNYYKESVSSTNLLASTNGTTLFIAGYQLTLADVTADLGASWINLEKPAGYDNGMVMGYPVITIDPLTNVINVVYQKSIVEPPIALPDKKTTPKVITPKKTRQKTVTPKKTTPKKPTTSTLSLPQAGDASLIVAPFALSVLGSIALIRARRRRREA